MAQTSGFELTAFDVGAAGVLSNRRVGASLAEPFVAPHGTCADAEGDVWAATALGLEVVRVEEGGMITRSVTTSQNAYACADGGPEGRHCAAQRVG